MFFFSIQTRWSAGNKNSYKPFGDRIAKTLSKIKIIYSFVFAKSFLKQVCLSSCFLTSVIIQSIHHDGWYSSSILEEGGQEDHGSHHPCYCGPCSSMSNSTPALRLDEYLLLGPVNPNTLQHHSQSYITSNLYTMPPRANQRYCMIIHG